MRRREFLKGAFAGAASFGTLNYLAACTKKSTRDSLFFKPQLYSDRGSWTFLGSEEWSQNSQGILFSPVWNQTKDRYGDLLKREDYAYPSREVLSDTDLNIEFQTFYWSVTNISVVIRAQDSMRFYCVEFNDMGRKGPLYQVRLFIQDSSGYRRDIATGFAPHSELLERWVQRGPKPEEWEQATPGWMKARVRAHGDLIRVSMDGESVLEFRDGTYQAGRAGIMARGPVKFRNLSISGTRGILEASWEKISEERPKYFYPYPDPHKIHGDNQTYPECAGRQKETCWCG